jgi:hypothetical protein
VHIAAAQSGAEDYLRPDLILTPLKNTLNEPKQQNKQYFDVRCNFHWV